MFLPHGLAKKHVILPDAAKLENEEKKHTHTQTIQAKTHVDNPHIYISSAFFLFAIALKRIDVHVNLSVYFITKLNQISSFA